ncbi:mitochondrial genome maintenance MGM101-domain-containing protein [Syncephalis plumigaleata]|nr:mitochondrial genome maintenance MGM101-domain-containing protein [Syncephalis plumigaleata]
MVTTSQHTRAALYSTYTYSSKTSTTSGTSNDAKSSSSSAVAKAPFPPTSNSVLANNNNGTTTEGLINDPSGDWARSFHGLSVEPFPKEVADVLLAPIATQDVEIKPDGMLYLPEIKYRRILNRAFGPGGWGLAPRGEHSVSPRTISREYALVCHGRFVAQARGEQDYFDPDGLATAAEGCKSNALMRCCKDLGIASELWDPTFIRQFKQEHCAEVMTEHISTKKRRKLWRRKTAQFDYPYKEIK